NTVDRTNMLTVRALDLHVLMDLRSIHHFAVLLSLGMFSTTAAGPGSDCALSRSAICCKAATFRGPRDRPEAEHRPTSACFQQLMNSQRPTAFPTLGDPER